MEAGVPLGLGGGWSDEACLEVALICFFEVRWVSYTICFESSFTLPSPHCHWEVLSFSIQPSSSSASHFRSNSSTVAVCFKLMSRSGCVQCIKDVR